MTLIRYDNISISHDDNIVLKNFNLSVLTGDKMLIVGRSGLGKSTIFKTLLGFVKPIAGSIYFKDKSISETEIWEIRRQIAYVSQNTDIDDGKVKDIINDIFQFNYNKSIFWQSDLQHLLDYFELEKNILNKKFETLSGGEKQRICIIISILLHRDIFLLDEVTSDLDNDMKLKVADYFLNKEKWTVLIISHDVVWKNENIKIVDLSSYVVK